MCDFAWQGAVDVLRHIWIESAPLLHLCSAARDNDVLELDTETKAIDKEAQTMSSKQTSAFLAAIFLATYALVAHTASQLLTQNPLSNRLSFFVRACVAMAFFVFGPIGRSFRIFFRVLRQQKHIIHCSLFIYHFFVATKRAEPGISDIAMKR